MTAVATKSRKKPAPDDFDWTLAWVPDLRRWEAEGVGIVGQAERLWVSPGTLSKARKRHGLVKERADRVAALAKAVLDAHARGLSVPQIVGATGQTESVVRFRLKMLGLAARKVTPAERSASMAAGMRRTAFRMGESLSSARYRRERLATTYDGWPAGATATQARHLGVLFDRGPLTARDFTLACGFALQKRPTHETGGWAYELLGKFMADGWVRRVGRAKGTRRCRVTLYDLTPKVRERRKLALHRQRGDDQS